MRHFPENGHIPENSPKMPLTSYRKRANCLVLPDFAVDMFALTGTALFSRVDRMFTPS